MNVTREDCSVNPQVLASFKWPCCSNSNRGKLSPMYQLIVGLGYIVFLILFALVLSLVIQTNNIYNSVSSTSMTVNMANWNPSEYTAKDSNIYTIQSYSDIQNWLYYVLGPLLLHGYISNQNLLIGVVLKKCESKYVAENTYEYYSPFIPKTYGNLHILDRSKCKETTLNLISRIASPYKSLQQFFNSTDDFVYQYVENEIPNLPIISNNTNVTSVNIEMLLYNGNIDVFSILEYNFKLTSFGSYSFDSSFWSATPIKSYIGFPCYKSCNLTTKKIIPVILFFFYCICVLFHTLSGLFMLFSNCYHNRKLKEIADQDSDNLDSVNPTSSIESWKEYFKHRSLPITIRLFNLCIIATWLGSGIILQALPYETLDEILQSTNSYTDYILHNSHNTKDLQYLKKFTLSNIIWTVKLASSLRFIGISLGCVVILLIIFRTFHIFSTLFTNINSPLIAIFLYFKKIVGFILFLCLIILIVTLTIIIFLQFDNFSLFFGSFLASLSYSLMTILLSPCQPVYFKEGFANFNIRLSFFTLLSFSVAYILLFLILLPLSIATTIYLYGEIELYQVFNQNSDNIFAIKSSLNAWIQQLFFLSTFWQTLSNDSSLSHRIRQKNKNYLENINLASKYDLGQNNQFSFERCQVSDANENSLDTFSGTNIDWIKRGYRRLKLFFSFPPKLEFIPYQLFILMFLFVCLSICWTALVFRTQLYPNVRSVIWDILNAPFRAPSLFSMNIDMNNSPYIFRNCSLRNTEYPKFFFNDDQIKQIPSSLIIGLNQSIQFSNITSMHHLNIWFANIFIPLIESDDIKGSYINLSIHNNNLLETYSNKDNNGHMIPIAYTKLYPITNPMLIVRQSCSIPICNSNPTSAGYYLSVLSDISSEFDSIQNLVEFNSTTSMKNLNYLNTFSSYRSFSILEYELNYKKKSRILSNSREDRTIFDISEIAGNNINKSGTNKTENISSVTYNNSKNNESWINIDKNIHHHEKDLKLSTYLKFFKSLVSIETTSQLRSMVAESGIRRVFFLYSGTNDQIYQQYLNALNGTTVGGMFWIVKLGSSANDEMSVEFLPSLTPFKNISEIVGSSGNLFDFSLQKMQILFPIYLSSISSVALIDINIDFSQSGLFETYFDVKIIDSYWINYENSSNINYKYLKFNKETNSSSSLWAYCFVALAIMLLILTIIIALYFYNVSKRRQIRTSHIFHADIDDIDFPNNNKTFRTKLKDKTLKDDSSPSKRDYSSTIRRRVNTSSESKSSDSNDLINKSSKGDKINNKNILISNEKKSAEKSDGKERNGGHIQEVSMDVDISDISIPDEDIIVLYRLSKFNTFTLSILTLAFLSCFLTCVVFFAYLSTQFVVLNLKTINSEGKFVSTATYKSDGLPWSVPVSETSKFEEDIQTIGHGSGFYNGNAFSLYSLLDIVANIQKLTWYFEMFEFFAALLIFIYIIYLLFYSGILIDRYRKTKVFRIKSLQTSRGYRVSSLDSTLSLTNFMDSASITGFSWKRANNTMLPSMFITFIFLLFFALIGYCTLGIQELSFLTYYYSILSSLLVIFNYNSIKYLFLTNALYTSNVGLYNNWISYFWKPIFLVFTFFFYQFILKALLPASVICYLRSLSTKNLQNSHDILLSKLNTIAVTRPKIKIFVNDSIMLRMRFFIKALYRKLGTVRDFPPEFDLFKESKISEILEEDVTDIRETGNHPDWIFAKLIPEMFNELVHYRINELELVKQDQQNLQNIRDYLADISLQLLLIQEHLVKIEFLRCKLSMIHHELMNVNEAKKEVTRGNKESKHYINRLLQRLMGIYDDIEHLNQTSRILGISRDEKASIGASAINADSFPSGLDVRLSLEHEKQKYSEDFMYEYDHSYAKALFENYKLQDIALTSLEDNNNSSNENQSNHDYSNDKSETLARNEKKTGDPQHCELSEYEESHKMKQTNPKGDKSVKHLNNQKRKKRVKKNLDQKSIQKAKKLWNKE
ncbi:uncharacterized protein CMU_037020 [Cryptosporidium muris RN66]|uniref:Uncharacterized protein n=1 Tax=Cryptosporidium muris (strain RN66) TaxID=441375 RepID=B6AH37_CRYMR|nr:uncharacterized protein CMU_037020 [Cryptosporidium muris RN66]EEA07528.1 hypothetical protein, conserved [Cryptosporidium muris RN66]|eukprot:XP_002141877.1 hypothetical protein [Cryptosporidium muris RN66]